MNNLSLDELYALVTNAKTQSNQALVEALLQMTQYNEVLKQCLDELRKRHSRLLADSVKIPEVKSASK